MWRPEGHRPSAPGDCAGGRAGGVGSGILHRGRAGGAGPKPGIGILEAVCRDGIALKGVPATRMDAGACAGRLRRLRLCRSRNRKGKAPPSISGGGASIWTAEVRLRYGAAMFLAGDSRESRLLPKEPSSQDGMALACMPDELKTPELCMEAVKQYGVALRFVPKELRTAETCLVAVKQEAMAFKYVPEAMQTEDVCLEFFRQVTRPRSGRRRSCALKRSGKTAGR